MKQRGAREESNVIINTSSQHGGPCERKGNPREKQERVLGSRLGKESELVALRDSARGEGPVPVTVSGRFVGWGRWRWCMTHASRLRPKGLGPLTVSLGRRRCPFVGYDGLLLHLAE